MASELMLAASKAARLVAIAHGLSRISHLIPPRDKIEILRDAQVFPKAESLCHVTDFALNRFAFGNHVMTEASAVPIVGPKQSAEHPQERRLAAAVGTEESKNLPGAHP